VRGRLRRAKRRESELSQRLPPPGPGHEAGTVDLAVPKLREGSYYPGWLLEPRRRAERALTQVVCQCYVEGVSTRRVDDIVKAMGIEGISKSQVSVMAKELDATVEAFRSRPLEAGPYTYVWLDAVVRHEAPFDRAGGRSPPLARRSRLLKLGAA